MAFDIGQCRDSMQLVLERGVVIISKVINRSCFVRERTRTAMYTLDRIGSKESIIHSERSTAGSVKFP